LEEAQDTKDPVLIIIIIHLPLWKGARGRGKKKTSIKAREFTLLQWEGAKIIRYGIEIRAL